jgi:hypothetical protein
MSQDQFLSRLAELPSEKPSTKMGQVRWAWRHIQAALAAGHTLRTIQSRLAEVGIQIEYRTLSLYIGRLQRQAIASGDKGLAASPPVRKSAHNVSKGDFLASRVGESTGTDPFSNVRLDRERKKQASFDYDAFSTNKDLLR